jgi:hypothetical protein
MSVRMTLFGDTLDDKKRTLGLIVTLVIVLPFIVGIYILSTLKVKCVK